MPDGSTQPLQGKTDWDRLRAKTDEEVMTAALADPDARPMTDEEFARARRTSRAKIIRRALRLTQEEFSARFHIPLGTLRDWEQGKAAPDQSAQAYLQAIAGDAEAVRRALEAAPRAPRPDC
jgi:putative transcriptional regulator